MKVTETVYQEAFEEMNAWNVVKHLVITLIFGFVLDRLSPSPFLGFWFMMAGIGFIANLGLLITKVSAQHKRDERTIEELKQVSFEEKQTQIEQVQSVIERRANELKAEANAIQDKATALESIANDNATLGKERRTLEHQLQTLGKEIANAEIEKQTLIQSHHKETRVLLTKLSLAEKEAVSLRKKLEGIEREEEGRVFRNSVKGSWSSFKKDTAEMDKKFGKGNWEIHIKR